MLLVPTILKMKIAVSGNHVKTENNDHQTETVNAFFLVRGVGRPFLSSLS